MILTIQSLSGTTHINISLDQFKRLRDPSLLADEMNQLATACGCNVTLLKDYVEDLKKSAKEMIEMDGSCDYSNHL